MVGSTRSVAIWAAATFAASAVQVGHAWRTRQQFYPAAVYVATSKAHMLIAGNLAMFVYFLVCQSVKTLLLGKLSAGERERLWEKTKEALMDTLLLMTVFRDEFDAGFLAQFTVLFSIKMFHWLAQDRVEFLSQLPRILGLTHVRLVSLFALLCVVNVMSLRYHATHAFDPVSQTVTISVMFGFEYLLCLCALLATIGEYVITVIDMRRQGHWDGKGEASLYLHVIHDALRLFVYFTFFSLILTFYGFPLHIIRPLYMSVYSFRRRFMELIAYRRATRDMDRRFPEASEADLGDDRKCIVCHCNMVAKDTPPAVAEGEAGIAAADAVGDAGVARQPAHRPVERGQRPMKLPCGHIFHFSCLREWLERQPSCPTCKRDVMLDEPPARAAAPAAAAAHARGAHQQANRRPANAGVEDGVDRDARRAARHHRRRVRELVRTGMPQDVAVILAAAQGATPSDRATEANQTSREEAAAAVLSVAAAAAVDMPQAEILSTLARQIDTLHAQLVEMRTTVAVLQARSGKSESERDENQGGSESESADTTTDSASKLAGAAATPPTAQVQSPQVAATVAQSSTLTPTSSAAATVSAGKEENDDLDALDPELAEALRMSVEYRVAEPVPSSPTLANSQVLQTEEDPAEARRRRLAESAEMRLSQQMRLTPEMGEKKDGRQRDDDV